VDIQTATFEFGIKAVEVHEDDSGDLIIEGYASDFLTDRDAEAFEPGAFERGLKAYLDSNPILLYHHDPSKQLGVVEAAAVDGKGMPIRARIPKPPSGSWAEHVYGLVKRGMMRGFSVGGAFQRRLTPDGPRIFDVDLQEISVTPLPVNPRTLFNVAGKAFEAPAEEDPYADAKAQLEAIETILNTVEQSLS
jgi:HK97 family phage prohead protease